MKRMIFLALLVCVFVGCEEAKKPEFYEKVPGWRMPELAITNLAVEPERANPGDTVRLIATVSNLGTAETKAARIIFRVDELEIAQKGVKPLPPSGVTKFTIPWTAGDAGRHRVIAALELG